MISNLQPDSSSSRSTLTRSTCANTKSAGPVLAFVMLLVLSTVAFSPGAVAPASQPQSPPLAPAHFHHMHLNTTDPSAAINFYTSKFDCEKKRFAGLLDAVWAQ